MKDALIILFVFCPIITATLICWIWEKIETSQRNKRRLEELERRERLRAKARAKKNAVKKQKTV